MAQTSVHLKACDIAASETHNKREKDLDYVRKELSHLNKSFSYSGLSLPAELAAIKRDVKEKTGRKLQKNAIPIKEGVIVIEDKTTMDDLKRFCAECRKQFGIIPLQIHIHRDEGHSKSKDWKPNLHAHIVWRMYGENGRNVRLSREDCAAMQTIAAQTLGMERGKSSSKKHLSSLEFKISKLEEQARELDGNLKEVEQTLKGAFEGAKEGVYDLFTLNAGKKVREARKMAENAKKETAKTVKYAVQKITEERKKAEASEKAMKEAQAQSVKDRRQLYLVKQEWEQHKEDLKEIEDIRSKRADTLQILEDASNFGLTTQQTLNLVKNKSISLLSIRDPKSGDVIEYEDERPIHLKLEKGRIFAKFVLGWELAKEWIRQALDNPWFKRNGIPNKLNMYRNRGI